MGTRQTPPPATRPSPGQGQRCLSSSQFFVILCEVLCPPGCPSGILTGVGAALDTTEVRVSRKSSLSFGKNPSSMPRCSSGERGQRAAASQGTGRATWAQPWDKCLLIVLWGGERGTWWAFQGQREGSGPVHFCRSRVGQGLIGSGSRKLDIISGKEALINCMVPYEQHGAFLQKQPHCVRPKSLFSPRFDRSCPPGSPLGAHRTGQRVYLLWS